MHDSFNYIYTLSDIKCMKPITANKTKEQLKLEGLIIPYAHFRDIAMLPKITGRFGVSNVKSCFYFLQIILES